MSKARTRASRPARGLRHGNAAGRRALYVLAIARANYRIIGEPIVSSSAFFFWSGVKAA